VNEWLAGRTFVSPEAFADLCAQTGASEAYARTLLRASGVPLDPLVEGIRQDSFAELERTLLGMPATPAGRRLVLLAKDHARLAMRSPQCDRAQKQEMLLWLTLWLETPDLFPPWLALRLRAGAPPPEEWP